MIVRSLSHWGRRPPACRRCHALHGPKGLNPSEGESDCLEFKLAGPKAGKVSVPPFQRGAGSRGRAPVARRNGRNPFPKGAFYFGSTFLFARKKERWKPCAPCRGRHPGRGAAGLLVTNGGSRLELKSPTGRCQGDARAAHQKHPSGMFLRAGERRAFLSKQHHLGLQARILRPVQRLSPRRGRVLRPALTGRFASLRARLLRRRRVSERNRAKRGS